jgi:hypothetical protein
MNSITIAQTLSILLIISSAYFFLVSAAGPERSQEGLVYCFLAFVRHFRSDSIA